jgi:hypothetical protein
MCDEVNFPWKLNQVMMHHRQQAKCLLPGGYRADFKNVGDIEGSLALMSLVYTTDQLKT